MRYSAEQAVSPLSGVTNWVVIDDQYSLHREASAYLQWLTDGRNRSMSTARAYAGRLALFLTWAHRHNVDWKTVTLTHLSAYKRWLEETPVGADEPPRIDRTLLTLRSGATVNAHLTAVGEMLRFAASQGMIEDRVATQLTEQRFLTVGPRGYDMGEQGQWRTVRARLLVSLVEEPAIETLTDDEVGLVMAACSNVRDRFLVYGLRATGLRIGEQLGLRRSDMHLLPTSQHLDCRYPNAHVHVIRRVDNDNGALAKSRYPRIVPVDDAYVAMYRDYQYLRDTVPEARDRDLVFVNLYRAPLGRGMTYRSLKDTFERLSKKTNIQARPHMLRHSFATRLIEDGVEIDVVRELLGHVSLASTGIYIHPKVEAMRAAVRAASLGQPAEATL